MPLEINKLYNGDCLEVMKSIDSQSIDMILCDLPFQITQSKWDTIIPFEPLWEQYNRIIKKNGAIVLFGSQPFTSKLVISNEKMFKYEIIWIKHQGTNPAFSNRGILKAHENICVFYSNQPTYNPQFDYDKPYGGFNSRLGKKIGEAYGDAMKSQHRDNPTGERYPVSFVYFANPNQTKIHPTQKPLPLLEYLIKTYTNEGDLVLDNAAGSGSTCLAARNIKRNFIGIEKDPEYFKAAQDRIKVDNL